MMASEGSGGSSFFEVFATKLVSYPGILLNFVKVESALHVLCTAMAGKQLFTN